MCLGDRSNLRRIRHQNKAEFTEVLVQNEADRSKRNPNADYSADQEHDATDDAGSHSYGTEDEVQYHAQNYSGDDRDEFPPEIGPPNA